MAVVPYVVTQLGSRRILVEWPNLVSGDSGQPFDASALKFESAHKYRTSQIDGSIRFSNEASAPLNGFTMPIPFDSTTGGAGVNVLPNPFRWFYIDTVSNGGVMTVSMLFREINDVSFSF